MNRLVYHQWNTPSRKKRKGGGIGEERCERTSGREGWRKGERKAESRKERLIQSQMWLNLVDIMRERKDIKGYTLFDSIYKKISVQFSRSVLSLCDPMNCSTPGFPVLHYLPEFAQTHVHWVGDAIQPSHPPLPLFLLPSIFPRIRVFSNELAQHIR